MGISIFATTCSCCIASVWLLDCWYTANIRAYSAPLIFAWAKYNYLHIISLPKNNISKWNKRLMLHFIFGVTRCSRRCVF